MNATSLSTMWTSGIQPPIPRRKHQNVAEPKRHRGAKKLGRRFALPGKTGYEHTERPDHGEGDNGGDQGAQNSVQFRTACSMRHSCGDDEEPDYGEQKPAWTEGQAFR